MVCKLVLEVAPASILRKVTKCVTLANMNAHTSHTTAQAVVKARDIPNWLLSHGITSATTEDIARYIDVPANQVRQRMATPAKRSEIVSPARGLWVPVAPEYREWGGPEAITYIDSLMRHLNAHYYVGWMSAAALLGASHHASQVFQVASSKVVANRVIGRSDIRFYVRSNVSTLPTFQFKTQTGFATVSTRAATMLSIANDMEMASGPNNAANVIIELSETDDAYLQEVADCSSLFPASALRRLGWILDTFADGQDLEPLAAISQMNKTKLSKLSMYDTYSGRIDKKWSLDINTRIEPDV